MNSDRQLLELAAKAIGLQIECWGSSAEQSVSEGFFIWIDNDPLSLGLWNPLLDDGDALRLAVKMDFDIELRVDCVLANGFGVKNCQTLEGCDDDKLAATRKAIVHAAALIGAGKK